MDDKFDTLHVIPAGTKYYEAAREILLSAGIEKINIQDNGAVLPIALKFEAGEEKLSALNNLFTQVNYEQLSVDVEGFYTSYPYRSPAIRAIDYTYQDDSLSVTYD